MSKTVVTETTPAPKPGVAALDALFESVNRSDAPGLVVGVAHHGRILYRRGFGLASVELGVANAPSTRMRIGSASKQFTSLAALLLAEEGKLDLDFSARLYLPELPPLKGEPTLRQFMTHTSGYRCSTDLGMMRDGMAIQPKSVGLATVVRQTDVNFAPGEKMMYSNTGYHLLSLIIERVSGLTFKRFLKERIFTPLGMLDTDSVPSDFEIHRGVATLHVDSSNGGYQRGMFPSEEVLGEGAIISTVDDTLRWLAHLRGPRQLGSDQSWTQMLTPTKLNNGTVNPYALGLMTHLYRGVEVIHHPGGVIGGSAQMLTVPSQALDIVIFSNRSPGPNTVELANRVVEVVLGDEALGPLETKVASERFKGLLGRRYYSPSSGFVFGLADAQEKLGLRVLDGPPVPLSDGGDTLYLGFETMAIGPFAFSTTKLGADGAAPASLEFSESGQAESFELLPELPPALSDVGPPLVGRYRAVDLNTEARVYFEDASLKLHISGAFGTNRFTMQAFSNNVFGWGCVFESAQIPFQGVLNVERKEGRIAGFRLNTTRTRRLLFERISD